MKFFFGILVWGGAMSLVGLFDVAVARIPVPSNVDPDVLLRVRAYRRTTPYIFLASFLALLVGSVGMITQATIATPTPRYFAAAGGYGAVVAAVGVVFGVLGRRRSAPERVPRRELLRTAGRWTRRVGVLAALAGTLGRIVVGHW